MNTELKNAVKATDKDAQYDTLSLIHILEPLLKELTELVAARQDSEEIRQLDKEIKDISEQSQILNQVDVYKRQSKGTEPERHSDNPGCRKMAGRGDTGHSEKSDL